MTRAVTLALALVVSFGSGIEAGDCGCAEARREHGWCDSCELGYVGGAPIRSRYLWEVLDAHGHALDVENLGCAGCTEAFRSDGYCAESRIGFIRGQAYFSRLTWLLAGAELEEPSSIGCPRCREHAAGSGWCEACNVGRVGAYAVRDRADFEALVREMETLSRANAAAQRCEPCAAAIVTETVCPFHR